MNRLASRAAPPLLVDFGHVPAAHCDDCLEGLFKALAANPEAEESAIWRRHENPWLAEHIEDLTAWMQRALTAIQDAMAAAMTGRPIGALKKADAWERMGDEEREATRARLEALTPAAWTLEDWLSYADLLMADYLPAGVIQDMAEFAIVRGQLAGKIAAEMDRQARPILPGAAERLVSALPVSRRSLPPKILTPVERAILDVATERCAIFISDLTADTRKRIKLAVTDGIRHTVLGEPEGNDDKTASRLFDEFGDLNRDWRRVAVTETGEAHNTGYVAGHAPGTKLRRVEAYRGACDFCASVNGRVFRVVEASDPARDGETDVWVGKTNARRSASPKKREGGVLVERSPDERWWVAAGVMHPHCFISPRVPIYTQEGWRPINSIKLGDMVLTHQGRFRPVTWVLSDARHTGDVFRFRLTSGGKNPAWSPAMTGEHPLLLDDGTWRAAQDIRAGDHLVSLARSCDGCGAAFVNLKHPQVRYCGAQCVPHSGRNQFTDATPEQRAAACAVTGEGNRRRLARMTVEERRALTAPLRAKLAADGFPQLQTPEARRRGAQQSARNNYQPSPTERAIAAELHGMGLTPSLQHRIPKAAPRPRSKFWWADIALPEQKIAVEVDGKPWHDRMNGGRDATRDEDLQASGWTVLRFAADAAKADPAAIAEQVARLAMNHDGAYRFAPVEVVAVERAEVAHRPLYNFAVADDESYIAGRGLVVHNCRGRWVQQEPAPEADGPDPEFMEWLRGELRAAGFPQPSTPASR